MNPNNAMEFFQKGFHVTLGATTALVESLQDSQKREENLSQLNLGFDELTQIWADKGADTESEARTLIENMVAQYGPQSGPMSSTSSSAPGSSTPVVNPALQQELKDLTDQLASIRTELDQASDGPTQ